MTVTRPGPRLAGRPLYVAAAGTVAAVLADVAFDPARRHVPLCPFHALTGQSCPLCGGLRAVDALVHLQLPAAVHDNVLVLAGLPLLVFWWLDTVLRARSGRARRTLSRRLIGTVVALAIAFTVLRNLPFAAGLRPT